MKNFRLVIKGAFYYDKEDDCLLVPHYTGEFSMVDCDRYKLLEDLKESYDDSYIESVKHSFIIYEDKKYYYAEYSPMTVDKNWELLSDLSELHHI